MIFETNCVKSRLNGIFSIECQKIIALVNIFLEICFIIRKLDDLFNSRICGIAAMNVKYIIMFFFILSISSFISCTYLNLKLMRKLQNVESFFVDCTI